MSLGLSFLIAIFGAALLIVASHLGGPKNIAANTSVAAALLAEEPQGEGVLPSNSFGQELQADSGQKRVKCWLLGAALALFITVLFLKSSIPSLIITAGIGALAGELFNSRRREAAQKLRLKKMEFYLPTVMERIVMAVGSGLDIVPALREASLKGKDPVSELMRWIVSIAESGTPVDSAFEMAAQQKVTVSVKHACIHLGLAYRQGGEIVRPLKELSDATQVAYQETIEEQIAKLPVKAVLPLVLTFTGLIVCFLTVPMMQIGSITKEVASVAGH